MRKQVGERLEMFFTPDEEIYVGRGELTQVVWSAPAMKDDDGKIRCPKGFIKIRLWKKGERDWVLSQSVKAITGGADVPLRSGFSINEKDVLAMSENDLEEFIFTLKGDYDLMSLGDER